uniref:Uncharacterized protein n=1 Tax=Monodelphis domestica TaxID=13616 RepID=A0A5F8GNH6_MONDO
ILGVGKQGSSLHLHFLKTLESRTDLSVMSIHYFGSIIEKRFLPISLSWI